MVFSRATSATSRWARTSSPARTRSTDSLPDRIELAEARPPAKLRVAWSMDLGYVPIEDEVRQNTLAALEALRAAGCTVEEVELGWGSWVDEAAMSWYAAMHFGRAALWAAEQGQREQLTDYGRLAADIAARLGPDDVARSWEGQHRMYQSLGPVLADYDVLLCPTLSIGAVRTDHDATNPAFEVAGTPVDGEYGWLLTHQFNMQYNCPVITLPSGRDRHGVPTGIQLVTRPFDDAGLFEAAYTYEHAMAGAFLPGPRCRQSRSSGGPDRGSQGASAAAGRRQYGGNFAVLASRPFRGRCGSAFLHMNEPWPSGCVLITGEETGS